MLANNACVRNELTVVGVARRDLAVLSRVQTALAPWVARTSSSFRLLICPTARQGPHVSGTSRR